MEWCQWLRLLLISHVLSHAWLLTLQLCTPHNWGSLTEKNISFYHLEKYFSHLTLALERGELMNRWSECLTLMSSNSFITEHRFTYSWRYPGFRFSCYWLVWRRFYFSEWSWMSHDKMKVARLCRAEHQFVWCPSGQLWAPATIIFHEEAAPSTGQYFTVVSFLRSLTTK